VREHRQEPPSPTERERDSREEVRGGEGRSDAGRGGMILPYV